MERQINSSESVLSDGSFKRTDSKSDSPMYVLLSVAMFTYIMQFFSSDIKIYYIIKQLIVLIKKIGWATS